MGTGLRFTHASFVRSHGKGPRGFGSWGFQATTGDMAFTEQLTGEIVWSPAMTLTDAKWWMGQQGRSGLWAVMP